MTESQTRRSAAIASRCSQEGVLLAQPMQARPLGLTYGFSGATADLRTCAEAIRRGSKSFHMASLVLPRSEREAAQALYAFCRHSDDLIDDPRATTEALDRLRDRLERIYSGTPLAIACDRAFARAVQRHAIPKAVPDALLDGFASDLAGRRYHTLDELRGYATCVAATVGIMMSMVMGASDAVSLARASDLGIAMQLTNIARDVGEDARNGRLYLPTDWLEEEGIDPDAFVANPVFTPALGNIVRRLLAEAERHYVLGRAGIARLPARCRPAIRAAAAIYEAIGREIARNGFNSVDSRAHTTLVTKLSLVRQSITARAHEDMLGDALVNTPADPSASALVSLSALAAESGRTGLNGAAETAEPLPPGMIDRFAVIMSRVQVRAHQSNAARRGALRRTSHA